MVNISAYSTGGQTQLHKLRMIKQVIGATMKVSLWIFLISFVVLVYLNHPWQDFWFLGAYLKAHFLTNCPKLIADLSPSTVIYNRDGSEHLVSNYFIMTDANVWHWVQTILWSFFKKSLQALLIASGSSVLISWFWVLMGKQKQETKVLSGFELVDPKILKKRILKLGTSPYQIADVPIPKNTEFQHLMITGTTGSGKSNMIHQLLSQIRAQGDQAIVVDTTGGIFSRFYDSDKNDILLNPLDARSDNWNIWDEIINDYVLEDIAESMIPETKSFDTFWVTSGRQLLCECIRYLRRHNLRSYHELLKMTLKISLKDLSQRLQGTSVSAIVDPSIDKTALSVRATLASNLRALEILQEANFSRNKSSLSLLNFLKEDKKTWLFMSCRPDQREFVKPLFSAWISLCIKGIMRRAEQNGSRTWIIIDELASLNRLPSLMLGLSEIRKYGGCFVLGFQDLNQLDEIYGAAATKTLSNLTGTKVLFRSVDTDVAKRVASYIGEQEKQEASESISFGAHQMRDGVNLSHQKQTKAVINASQIMMLKDLEAFLKFPGDLAVTKITFNYMQLDHKAPDFLERIIKPRASNQSSSETIYPPKEAIATSVISPSVDSTTSTANTDSNVLQQIHQL